MSNVFPSQYALTYVEGMGYFLIADGRNLGLIDESKENFGFPTEFLSEQTYRRAKAALQVLKDSYTYETPKEDTDATDALEQSPEDTVTPDSPSLALAQEDDYLFADDVELKEVEEHKKTNRKRKVADADSQKRA